jgi:signal transduction histidine kinase
MLEGISEHWSIPTDERTVHYAGLAPGVYRFLVRAVGADGRQSSQPAVLSFALLKPFWRRWWFIGLEAMTFAFVVFGLSRYRFVQLLAVERIRSRIATDLHDDIGSSLSRVAILSEVVRKRVGEADPEINAPLASIAEISRELIDSMGEIVWAINPAKDNLYFLTQRMREFASDVLMARDVQFEFRASNREHEFRIGADMRRQVLLIFKECVHNVVRHANCTRVEIDVRLEREGLVLQVRDNGIGIEPSMAVNGHGLASMRDRAQRVGGRIEFAAADQGTLMTLSVPLAKTPR